ncbi:pilus assembly protein PilM [Engelhardtia mirabilis]|uniref:Competence protein A n=1 Tax=Engelhardtia mirabilis TaxID=2528011 RepID=A0A518BSJ6_9BACT|nr:Competence protein A [Planctomycetes bacterium Pla133]QDV04271.1 Competence protein A [Planctomycetes bacterium Pla86]
MAKTCGIHLTERRFELVALDGNAKKPKVRLCLSGMAPSDAEDSLEAVGDALRGAAKAHRKQLSIDEVGLSLDSSLATYRFLSLPFADKDKIEEVLKFEVENQLPQWDIDEVVCDFIVLDATPVESHLLVTAVPKDEISARLELATRAGLEPLDVELDCTALFRAAEQAEVLDAEGAQLLVHFGPRTTTLVTADGGRMAGARALTLDLREFDQSTAAIAVVSDADDESASSGDATAAVEAALPGDPAARADAILQRVRRELGRTMTSLKGDRDVSAVLVCGIEVPGLVGSDVAGVAVTRLDPLEGQVDLPAADRSRLVIAYGAALGRLGAGDIRPHLRREELAYASKFERLELPLGVLGLLILTLLASLYITNGRVLDKREADVKLWLVANRNYMIGVPGTEYVGHLRPSEQELKDVKLYQYVQELAETGDLEGRDYRSQLLRLGSLLDKQMADLQEELGSSRDITQPMSAMSGLNMVLDVISALEADGTLGRFSIRGASSEYLAGRGGRDDRVKVVLDMTFFDDGATTGNSSYSALVRELENSVWLQEELERPSTTVLDTGNGIFANGLTIFVDTTKAALEN